MVIDGINHLDNIDYKNNFDAIKLSLVSPEYIRSRSYGEVKNPDTVNYRTNKPENGGLFCARIFGPMKDYECLCGKYKRMKYRNVVCEKCGVEVTLSKVRRQRMGHIELEAPVVHIWFLRSLPSRISTILDIPLKDIEKVLYFESHIVLNAGTSTLEKGQILTDEELYEIQDTEGADSFEAGIGADAIKTILMAMDLPAEIEHIRELMTETSSETKKKRYVKRLKMLESFKDSGNKPEWMVLDVLPVIPPELRPLVMLDGGRFATSDLNDLYRRIINRNNRLKRLKELKAPEIIIRNEKRMLQESVDALFDNGRRGRIVKNNNKRALKSLSDMLKGKQGRFRQNLLGKRVDYSGRSVIVVGPDLKLHQCGLPKKMGLELFKPFIYSKLVLYGMANNLKTAKKMVEAQKPEVWDILAEVIKDHPVLLNRAPTLHRLGIQAFEPVLVEGKAIQLHPLVCAAFNADFDGDQMAVHVPLSIEAQVEARVLMMSTNNILSPANGKPIIMPSQDMVLGLYYITMMDNPPKSSDDRQELKCYDTKQEIMNALNSDVIKLQTPIKYRVTERESVENDTYVRKTYTTTAGRVMLYDLLPEKARDFQSVNKLMTKKEIETMLDTVYRLCGQKSTVIFSDQIMRLGFENACRSGISIGKDDMVVPETKQDLLAAAEKSIKKYEDQYNEGLITHGEKYNKQIDEWSRCTEEVTKEMMKLITSKDTDTHLDVNSIYLMAHSGARGAPAQIRQLAAMRGLMAKPSGEIIEYPIKSNFSEGLSCLEYFLSTHGARKGLADTALKTANSGHLTRKLVDVSQDSIITMEDCGTDSGIIYNHAGDDEKSIKLSELVLGRVVANDITLPKSKKVVIKAGELIDEAMAEKIDQLGIESIKVRSPLTCEAYDGLCVKCYGRDLATGHTVNIGAAVGVIAAQSIGEPGTQLTMRTFHIGGAAQQSSLQSNIITQHEGKIKILNDNTIENSEGDKVVMSRNCEIVISDKTNVEKLRFKLPYGSKLFVKHGTMAKKNQTLAEWDPYTLPIITEQSGKITLLDLVDNMSVKEVYDEETGTSSKVITDWKQHLRAGDLKPRAVIVDDNGDIMTLSNGLPARYYLPVGAIINVSNGQKVLSGDMVARIPKESGKTKDITGGLPKVVELFEARKPKDHSIISEIDGVVEFGKDYKSKRKLVIRPTSREDKPMEYLIPRGRHITVNEGDYVSKGDTLMEGNPSLHDILRVMGVEALARYMVNEIQQVYRLQGVKIDDKHIETVLRQMLQKVEIIESGDSVFIPGEQVDRVDLRRENEKLIKKGMRPATSIAVLQGITKASLQTKSFFSAASFQETTRVLTEASISGKVDDLKGLKENIIVGRLIPAGTGYYANRVMKEAARRDKIESEAKYANEQVDPLVAAQQQEVADALQEINN